MKLTVVSWNTWGGKHRDEILRFLQTVPFDIAALQEVTVREVNEQIENDAEIIAHSLGYHVSYAKSFRTDRHFPVYDIGNAIISKFPIQHSITHTLSDLTTYEKNATTEPRNALQTDITINEKTLHVFSTHLGYSENLQATPLQRAQTEKLISVLPKDNTVLMGDFNSEPSSETIQIISQHLVHSDNKLTNPSWTNLKKEDKPQHRIDYIFTTPDITVQSFTVGKSDASDHSPLIADIEI